MILSHTSVLTQFFNGCLPQNKTNKKKSSVLRFGQIADKDKHINTPAPVVASWDLSSTHSGATLSGYVRVTVPVPVSVHVSPAEKQQFYLTPSLDQLHLPSSVNMSQQLLRDVMQPVCVAVNVAAVKVCMVTCSRTAACAQSNVAEKFVSAGVNVATSTREDLPWVIHPAWIHAAFIPSWHNQKMGDASRYSNFGSIKH